MPRSSAKAAHDDGRGAGISGSDWTVADVKKFEAVYSRYLNEEVSEKLWVKVAGQIPGKSVDQVVKYYRALADELRRIDAGEVPLPRYKDENGETPAAAGPTGKGAKSGTDQERRKGIPWSEEEHRLFLMGLAKFGKGDWRSISRNFVISRTPTQVASHAQKYFIRLNSLNKKDKRRSSIHDITSVQNTQAHASAPPQYAGGMYPAPMGGMHPSQHGPVGGSSQQFVYH